MRRCILTPRATKFRAVSLCLTTAATLWLNNPAVAESLKSQRVLLAQETASSCRQVTANNVLNVRREPSLEAAVVGTIAARRNVTIQNQGDKGWVPIVAPVEGYVFAEYLADCPSVPIPPSLCRAVQTDIGGLNVRREPSVEAAIIGQVANGRRVTIENQGDKGWVPINVPLNGYVSAQYLAPCTQ